MYPENDTAEYAAAQKQEVTTYTSDSSIAVPQMSENISAISEEISGLVQHIADSRNSTQQITGGINSRS